MNDDIYKSKEYEAGFLAFLDSLTKEEREEAQLQIISDMHMFRQAKDTEITDDDLIDLHVALNMSNDVNNFLQILENLN